MFPVAILAGGLATRLRPSPTQYPRRWSKLPACRSSCGNWITSRVKVVASVVLCVSHLGDQIEAVIGNGSRFGMRVRYAFDGPVLLGTGGALQQALRFSVKHSSCSTAIPSCRSTSWGERAFVAERRPALMTVLKNLNRWDKSNVEYRNGVVVEYNKHCPGPEMAVHRLRIEHSLCENVRKPSAGASF